MPLAWAVWATSPRFVAALLVLLSVTRADYIIDDGDHTVQYIPTSTSSSFGWVHASDNTAYGGTYTEGLCDTADNCSVEISFNGSGIIIYGRQYGDPLAFTVSLDGGTALPSQPFSLDHTVTLNVSLYSIQLLSLTPHIINVSLVAVNNAPSRIYFDYALVNTTAPPPGSSPVTSSSLVSSASAILSPTTIISSPTQQASYHSQFPLGAVVGGCIGGLAVLVIILVLLYLWRKKHMPVLSEIDPDPHHDSEYQSSPTQTMTFTPFISPFNSIYPNRPRSSMSQGHNIDTRVTSPSIPDSSATPAPPASTVDSTELYQSIPPIRKKSDDVVTSKHSPSSSSSSGRTQLTDAQADLVASLYTHNVPAPAIARIVQRIMAGQEIGDIDDMSTVTDGHEIGHGETTVHVAPPGYSES